MRIRVGYPSPEDETTLLASQQYSHPIDELEPVATFAGLKMK